MLLCPRNLLQLICTGTEVFKVESLSKNTFYIWPFAPFSSYFHQNVIKMVIYMLTKDKDNLIKVRELEAGGNAKRNRNWIYCHHNITIS